MTIRIFIIDEHAAAREMLARRLSSLPDMDVLGTTGDGGHGLRQIKELRPDVVLVDIKMRNADGMEVCRKACATSSSTRVAVLTSYIDPEERRMVRQAGGRGYLLKKVDTLRLAQCIRRLACPGSDEPKGGFIVNSLESC
jgi:DNA-binding NarL/FixJ family response regulator